MKEDGILKIYSNEMEATIAQQVLLGSGRRVRI